jgi:hypothetical protein
LVPSPTFTICFPLCCHKRTSSHNQSNPVYEINFYFYFFEMGSL